MLSDAIKKGLKKRIPNVKFVILIDHTMSWGVVIFEIPGLDSSKAMDVLYGQHNIGCAAMGPNIRFSPHFYIPLLEIERAVDAVVRLI